MSTHSTIWILIALCCTAGLATAQQIAPSAAAQKSTAQADAGEPRADTSTPSADTSAPPADTSTPPVPRAPGPSAAHTAVRVPAAGQKPSAKADRLDLGTATVTGDREQPKVMYIVPWKRSDIGDLAGKPMNSLVDEILAPVDRDVFKREVIYYHAVQAVSQNGAQPKAAPQGEK